MRTLTRGTVERVGRRRDDVRGPPIDGLNVDVSARVVRVVDGDACATAVRLQFVVGGDAIVLGAGNASTSSSGQPGGCCGACGRR